MKENLSRTHKIKSDKKLQIYQQNCWLVLTKLPRSAIILKVLFIWKATILVFISK